MRTKARIKRLPSLLIEFYVVGVVTIIAPPLLLWLYLSGHRDLAWTLVLVLPLPMLLVVLVLERREGHQRRALRPRNDI
jgi:hypothetical protein